VTSTSRDVTSRDAGVGQSRNDAIHARIICAVVGINIGGGGGVTGTRPPIFYQGYTHWSHSVYSWHLLGNSLPPKRILHPKDGGCNLDVHYTVKCLPNLPKPPITRILTVHFEIPPQYLTFVVFYMVEMDRHGGFNSLGAIMHQKRTWDGLPENIWHFTGTVPLNITDALMPLCTVHNDDHYHKVTDTMDDTASTSNPRTRTHREIPQYLTFFLF